MSLNEKLPPFDNPKVRRAISLASNSAASAAVEASAAISSTDGSVLAGKLRAAASSCGSMPSASGQASAACRARPSTSPSGLRRPSVRRLVTADFVEMMTFAEHAIELVWKDS